MRWDVLSTEMTTALAAQAAEEKAKPRPAAKIEA
jgi:hypothetical protein